MLALKLNHINKMGPRRYYPYLCPATILTMLTLGKHSNHPVAATQAWKCRFPCHDVIACFYLPWYPKPSVPRVLFLISFGLYVNWFHEHRDVKGKISDENTNIVLVWSVLILPRYIGCGYLWALINEEARKYFPKVVGNKSCIQPFKYFSLNAEVPKLDLKMV